MGDENIVYWPILCGNETEHDAFWNWYLTVNTTTPDLTTCFQNTLLVWIPCGLLWLMTPLYIYLVAKRPVHHPWLHCSTQNTSKTVGAASLTLLSLASVILKYVLPGNYAMTSAEITSSVLQTLTFVSFFLVMAAELGLATFYTRWLFRKGLHTSGPMLIYWLSSFLAHVIFVRSQNMTRRVHDAVFVCLCIQMALVSVEFLFSCVADEKARYMGTEIEEEKMPLLEKETNQEKRGKQCPKETASVLSLIFFSWFFRKFIWGLRRTLVLSDIWQIMDDLSTSVNLSKFSQEWRKEWEKSTSCSSASSYRDATRDSDSVAVRAHDKQSNESGKGMEGSRVPSLPWALLRTFISYYALGWILLLISLGSSLIGPQILQGLIKFVEGNDPFSWKGFLLAATLCMTTALAALTTQHHFYVCLLTTLKMRGALMAFVYRKALVISSTARLNVSIGSIVNMVAVDLNTLVRMMNQLNYIWATPLFVTVCMAFLWQQIGASCLAGLALLLVLLPVNSVILANKLKTAQKKQMELKERRLRLTGQILSGMKVLKLYAWEPFFAKELEELRKKEMASLRNVILLITGTFSLWFASPFLVTFACFVTYTLSSTDHILDAQKTFVSMSLISLMILPLTAFSQAIGSAVQGLVSLKRMEKYLLKEELRDVPRHVRNGENVVVSVEDGTFTWESDGVVCLKRINLDVKQGELLAVVGTVGSGKSSLIAALLGEMEVLQGSVSVEGSVAYVPQTSWIQNLTLRDNVLFSSPMDSHRYNNVLDLCALRPDLKIIPGGDLTEIGERGITLSGGQKQRVSLARAVYSDRDIYLLDDPLSAVDAHVGRELFEKVIGPDGVLQNKTRILVTHGVGYLPQMDRIIVMKDGCISEEGTYDELVEHNAAFAEFLRNYVRTAPEEDGSTENSAFTTSESNIHRVRLRSTSTAVSGKKQSDLAGIQKLIDEEKTSSGLIKLSVLRHFARAARWIYPSLLLASIVLFIAAQCMTQLWLSDWSQDKPVNGTRDEDLVTMRLGVYGGLAALQIVSVCGLSVSIGLGSVTASFNLHHELLSSVFHSPMRFFDTTPIGRILNRFSKDMDAVDQQIPVSMQIFLSNLVPLLSVLFLVLYTIPISAIVVVPLVLLFILFQHVNQDSHVKAMCFQRLYMVSASQLQRLDAICRSPVYAFLEESFTGAASIRAYGYKDQFEQQLDKLLDMSQSVWFEVLTSGRCLNATMQVLGSLIVAAAAFFGVMSRESLNPSSLGMVISFAMQVGLFLTMSVRLLCELEVQIVSVERIKEYSELEAEAPWKVHEQIPPKQWPEEGVVCFENYQARYRPGLELVLKGITCKILPREKVGVVGRTGAGKSSLTLSLFRLIEADGGVIEVDGRDISKMGLHDLRGRLSIIPQEPVLFSGSLRFNLDPSGQHSASDLWNALEKAHLEPFVASLPDGLEYMCAEGGDNLSVGQRQLVCLARALLRMSKILILDEATAAVDMETDDLIQATIRSQFENCTVITIAHRLNTVTDYDRVMVMDSGSVLEFDSPQKLLADTTSRFHSMAKDAHLF